MSTAAQLASYHQPLRELGPRQREVVDLLNRYYAKGLTAWELAGLTKRYVHAVRPRLTELRDLGVVRESGETWHAETGRKETVWKLVAFDDSGQMQMAL